MKSLLIKDFLCVKNQLKIYLLLAVFYGILSAATKSVSMFGSMLMLISVLLVINSMSYDERAKWDKYALSMPLLRKIIVLEKYVLGLILLTLCAAFSIISSLIFDSSPFGDIVLMNSAFFSIGVIFLALILPIFFKLGVEKGRTAMIIVILIPTLLIMFLPKLQDTFFTEQLITMLFYFFPAIALAVMLVSILISISIYQKKEF